MLANRTDQYFNKEHYEAEQIIKYGYTRILFEKLPEIVRDFTVGLALIEQLPNIAPFLLESAAYRIMLLLVNKDDDHYNLDMDSFFNNGIVDNLIECCRSRNWRSLRSQAAETLRELVRYGTMAQNQELLRRGVVTIFLQMLNDEETIDLDDEDWLDDLLTVEAVKTLALLSTKVDVRGDLVTAFVEQNLCRRLMLLFRNTRHTIVENVLTFVENFLTRGTEHQIQVLLDNQVLHHLRLVIVEPVVSDLYLLGGQYKAVEILGNFARRSIRLRDLVIDSGEDLISLFRVLHSLADDALVAFNASPAISAARTIGYLCFGSPPPSFDKLRPSLPILRFLINQLEPHIGEKARPAIKHACLIVACLARGGFDPINALIDENMCPSLVMLFAHPDSEVVASVLKVVENFLKNGTENQIQVLHDNQVLQHVLEILINHDNLPPLHLRSVCRAIANIVNYRSSQIQRMVDAGIFPSIIQVSINQEVGDTKYEAVYAISSAVTRGSHEQIRYLVDHGSIAALCQGLLCEGYTRRASCFQGLRGILRAGEAHKVDGVNVYTQMITENGGLARIKSQRDDRDVGEIARRLLSSYWPGEILGTGMDTQETSPSVLLCFDHERFIFNAGEGLQRFCTEYKIKLSQIDHICLTRVCSETTGGLPGLLLTLAGMKNGSSESDDHVRIWGPPNLDLLVNAMKTYVPHAVMTKKNIIPQSGSALAPPLYAEELRDVDKFKAVSISAFLLSPTQFSPNDTSIVYICKLHDIRGKVDIVKAKACGLEDKRKLGQLQKGISVKSDLLDIEVHPDDVIGPSIPGPIVLIVDCPTEPHAQELFSAQALDAYYSDSQSNSTNVVNCIIHLSPATVVNSPVYEKWMKKFDSAQHIMARATRKHETTPILASSTRIATRLHYLCPQLFPDPSFPSVQNDDDGVAAPNIKVPLEGSVCGISAENLLKFALRPPRKLGLDRSCVQNTMTSSVFIEELLSEIPEIADAAKSISKFWHKPKEDEVELSNRQDSNDVVTEEPSKFSVPKCLENVQREDLEIVFLGTGSSIPSKYRNVSSIYVNLFSKGGLLLDCGEGTLAQLKRRYGISGADSVVRNLKCIWISHIHADHHAGLARILALRHDLLKGVEHEPILVIGPEKVGEFLKEYIKLEDLDMLFLDCWSTTRSKWDNMEAEDSSLQPCSKKLKPSTPLDDLTLLKRLRKVLGEAGLVRLISFPVVHCDDAFGVILESADRMNRGEVVLGWKVVYSGDTRPCSEVINASLGATILIHEATFEDGLVEEAIARNHSTIKEALEVGDSAGAYRVILTHFSQRYPKVPALDEVSMQRTCIAFDLMSVNLADLPVLPKVLPYLKLLFRNNG
ncbi:hypothetical protein KY290_006210 [Solanum tuberosum]|uniref:ribonuclease Z n=1 Tax=Solanum tuberosum TaxID=4113 RepID=A0ABQ7WGB6_SOLTU|nr:hypothetical protein KY284_006318 [Solanum tuberosum]KAH0779783.1 hypothetical protein KY290_006210 [Solanum tuberosum]